MLSWRDGVREAKKEKRISLFTNDMANRTIEIMAPAGSWESLQAAIQGGANSIYFGIEQLNMRARSSNNFTLKDLTEIVELCSKKKY